MWYILFSEERVRRRAFLIRSVKLVEESMANFCAGMASSHRGQYGECFSFLYTFGTALSFFLGLFSVTASRQAAFLWYSLLHRGLNCSFCGILFLFLISEGLKKTNKKLICLKNKRTTKLYLGICIRPLLYARSKVSFTTHRTMVAHLKISKETRAD